MTSTQAAFRWFNVVFAAIVFDKHPPVTTRAEYQRLNSAGLTSVRWTDEEAGAGTATDIGAL
jgi:hypothetical protein